MVRMPVATVSSYCMDEWTYFEYQFEVMYFDLSVRWFSGVLMADISGEIFIEKVEGQREVMFKAEPVDSLLFSDMGWRDERFADVSCFCCDIEDFGGCDNPMLFYLGINSKGFIENKEFLALGNRSLVLEEMGVLMPPEIEEMINRIASGQAFCTETS